MRINVGVHVDMYYVHCWDSLAVVPGVYIVISSFIE